MLFTGSSTVRIKWTMHTSLPLDLLSRFYVCFVLIFCFEYIVFADSTSSLAYDEILCYVLVCVFSFWHFTLNLNRKIGFIIVASCVMTFEARDSAAKVVPARFKLSTNTRAIGTRMNSSRRTTGKAIFEQKTYNNTTK